MSDFIYYLRNDVFERMTNWHLLLLVMSVFAWLLALAGIARTHDLAGDPLPQWFFLLNACTFFVLSFEAGVCAEKLAVDYKDWKKHIDEETEIHDHI